MQNATRTPLLSTLAAVAAIAAPLSAQAHCWEDAARDYGIPAEVLKAVAKTESNFNSEAMNRNPNGTHDIGMMQINSTWLKTLESYGITESDLRQPCTNIKVGAWVLSNNAKKLGWNWNAIGAYNVGCAKLEQDECARRRNRYAWKIHTALQRAGSEKLEGRAPTVERPSYAAASTVSSQVVAGAGKAASNRKTMVIQLAMAPSEVSAAQSAATADAGSIASDYSVGAFMNYRDRRDD